VSGRSPGLTQEKRMEERSAALAHRKQIEERSAGKTHRTACGKCGMRCQRQRGQRREVATKQGMNNKRHKKPKIAR
jgi:hypothetical protein